MVESGYDKEESYKEKPPTFTEWYLAEYAKDKENLLPPPLPYDLGIHFLKQYLLGEDWYVNYSGSGEQITTDIVYAILDKYSKKFRKEFKKALKEEQKKRNGN